MEEDDRKASRTLKADQLDRSRALACALLSAAAVGLVLLLVHPWMVSRRSALPACQHLAHALTLSTPAWTPTGRASRQPEALHRAVDLRPSPALPLFDPSPDALLIPSPAPARSRP
jgi:hypothetical protein